MGASRLRACPAGFLAFSIASRVATVKHGDEGTTDFLTGLLRDHEKIAWILRAYLR